MIKNQNIICVSSIDWDFIWQGHQEIMLQLSKNGNRVLFIENTGIRTPSLKDFPRITKRIRNWLRGIKGIRKEMDNIYIYSPIILPFPYSRLANLINRFIILRTLDRIIKIFNFSSPIIWTFLPTKISKDIINHTYNKLSIYYCIDSFSSSSSQAKKIRRYEEEMIKSSDLVFVTSKELYNHCLQFNETVHMFPFGVSLRNFDNLFEKLHEALEEFKQINKPIIGYVGGVHKWIDKELILFLAKTNPDFSFVFVGPLQMDVSDLQKVSNVYFLGAHEYSMLPKYIHNFDVCIIPYLLTEYTKNVYPTKLNEYLIMGKPVVSTSLPEVIEFNNRNNNVVYISEDFQKFDANLKKALSENSESYQSERKKIARLNSWESRLEQMSLLINHKIKLKNENDESRWKEKFATFYRRSRRRALSAIVAIVVVCGIIFYTPLFWFLAKPLKIVQSPKNSDAIVVFAGGVGESGVPGQGFEERVKYAVDLYNEGFAENIIFSSGFTATFKEPYVMKSLAVSLGVPAEVIILEDQSGSTYENVEFTKEILLKDDFESIILVSSPYHMRRAQLVFKKNAPEVLVIYCPVPNSRFYSHGFNSKGKKVLKQINLRQIEAIFHECLGIIYYWFKGWI